MTLAARHGLGNLVAPVRLEEHDGANRDDKGGESSDRSEGDVRHRHLCSFGRGAATA